MKELVGGLTPRHQAAPRSASGTSAPSSTSPGRWRSPRPSGASPRLGSTRPFIGNRRSPAAAFQGFLAYRNYDSEQHLQDELVESEAPLGTSIFVSRNPKTKAMVAILLNFEAKKAFDASVEWAGCGGAALKRKFVYTGGKGATFVEEKGGSAETVHLPPSSITVLNYEVWRRRSRREGR